LKGRARGGGGSWEKEGGLTKRKGLKKLLLGRTQEEGPGGNQNKTFSHKEGIDRDEMKKKIQREKKRETKT